MMWSILVPVPEHEVYLTMKYVIGIVYISLHCQPELVAVYGFCLSASSGGSCSGCRRVSQPQLGGGACDQIMRRFYINGPWIFVI